MFTDPDIQNYISNIFNLLLFLNLTYIHDFFLISEVEAVEATRWLKEAGFPQYAQMYDGKLILPCVPTLWESSMTHI